MTDKEQFKVREEPFYQPQGKEVALYEAAYAARLPVMVKGPTGCGKSRFIEYMAWKLERPLITVACNEDMTASDLVGRYLLEANGTRWLDGPLTTAARIGAICYLDEVVEARQDTTVVIHPLTDHRRTLPLDKKGELLRAHADFQLVISYNPRLPEPDEGPQAVNQAALYRFRVRLPRCGAGDCHPGQRERHR
jgi:nitric oxide reductase NorQ protein